MPDIINNNVTQESKYIHDENTRFKIEVRRSKLFGLWVAELMGLTGDDATAYAKTLVMADLEEPGHEDLLRQAKSDLHFKKIDYSNHRFDHKLEELWIEAERQVMEEG